MRSGASISCAPSLKQAVAVPSIHGFWSAVQTNYYNYVVVFSDVKKLELLQELGAKMSRGRRRKRKG